MARKVSKSGRVNIQRIMNNTKRNATLRRRLPGIVKKTTELSVLCDVPACLVAYCPGKAEPVVWPSPAAAADVVRQYRATPNLDGFKNKLDGSDFLKQKNDKMRAKLSKVQMQCREEEIKLIVIDFLAGRRTSFDDLPIDLFVSVGSMVQNKLQAVNARIQEIHSGAAPALLPSPPPAPQSVPPSCTLGYSHHAPC
ncbi:unnamed protein product [Alopecurus aequalis]